MKALAIGGWGLAVILGAPAWAQVTQRVSLSSGGMQADGHCPFAAITPNGRYVVFSTYASNLVPGDTNGTWDVFLRDRRNGTTERISVDSAGVQGDAQSLGAWPSADGRFVAFSSLATNLVIGDTNGTNDAFVRDRVLNTTELVSISSGGAQGNDYSGAASISSDGRYVVFASFGTNLVPGDTNGAVDFFVRDRQTGNTERISVSSNGAQANGDNGSGRISADGRYVAFTSEASNLVPGDTNGFPDVFVRDRQNGTTERVSVDSNGGQASYNCFACEAACSISADGRFVVFFSEATNLVPGDTNGLPDVFVHDCISGATERVSVDSAGTEANSDSRVCSISGDGRYVVYMSYASNLVPADTNGFPDVFLRDRQAGTTELVSIDSAGVQGNSGSGAYPSITPDGRHVVFDAVASNLVPGDTNLFQDVFVRDRFGGPSFTSHCDPGVGGVMACPCSNTPSGPGRGCDNSSNTGGAILSAAGGTYLSSDSLVFTTSDEKPTALSVVTQWSGTSVAGVTFGQGVRCTSGTVKRLYTKSAVGGSITAPSFAIDPQVSVRSGALGDPIQAGESRWYVVYYRDPIVLGGCPATSTFNATQTGRIGWAP